MRLIQSLTVSASAMLTTACAVFGVRSEEGPIYKVVSEIGDKEVRVYQPYVVAKVTVDGSYRDAQSKAFRILANYIFGNNEGSKSIAMTAPVMQTPEGEEIAMTSPVTFGGDAQQWTMAFMMPSKYSLTDLPKAKDARIVFEEVPEHWIGAIKFSWWSSADRSQAKSQELSRWLIEQRKYDIVGPSITAGYDPPWTLPFLRRNEVWIPVKPLNGRP